MPESVVKYLKSENLEEHITTFGKDIKVYPIDEVCFNNTEIKLVDWGSSTKNLDDLAKKNISFKWEESKVNETRIFEVRMIVLKVLNKMLISHFLFQRKAHGRAWLEQRLANGNSLNVPVLDLVDSIMNVICSSRSDDELQTEVRLSA